MKRHPFRLFFKRFSFFKDLGPNIQDIRPNRSALKSLGLNRPIGQIGIRQHCRNFYLRGVELRKILKFHKIIRFFAFEASEDARSPKLFVLSRVLLFSLQLLV